MPLRTVKTILQQVVSVYGESVLDELDDMRTPEGSFVGAYLRRLVTNSKGVASAEPLQSAGVSESSAPTSSAQRHSLSPSGSRSSSDDIEVNQQLKHIFDVIGQPETSKQVRPSGRSRIDWRIC